MKLKILAFFSTYKILKTIYLQIVKNTVNTLKKSKKYGIKLKR